MIHRYFFPYVKRCQGYFYKNIKGVIPKLSFTMWTANYDRLPTRARLAAWGMASSPLCPFCSNYEESRDHLFQAASTAKKCGEGCSQDAIHRHIRLPTGQSCYLGLEMRHQSSFSLGNWRLNPLSITYGSRETI